MEPGGIVGRRSPQHTFTRPKAHPTEMSSGDEHPNVESPATEHVRRDLKQEVMKTFSHLQPLAFVVASAVGCASTYAPVSDQRLAATSDAYIKSGVRYDKGWFRGRLPELVDGVGQAEAYARDMKRSAILSFASHAASITAIIPYLVFSADQGQESTGAFTFLVLGGVLFLNGLFFDARSSAREQDAINAYNDALLPSNIGLETLAPTKSSSTPSQPASQ